MNTELIGRLVTQAGRSIPAVGLDCRPARAAVVKQVIGS
jgi:hypothetical protein